MSDRTFHILSVIEGSEYERAEKYADAATAQVVGHDDPMWPDLYRGTSEWSSALVTFLVKRANHDRKVAATSEPTDVGSGLEFFTSRLTRQRGRFLPRNGYALSFNQDTRKAALTRITEKSKVSENA